MALFLEFLAQQWILVAALLAALGMLVYHESRKAGPSLSPQQAINLVNAEQGVFLDLREGGRNEQPAEPRRTRRRSKSREPGPIPTEDAH